MVDCQEEQAKSSCDKNEKIKLHTLSFKLLVVKPVKCHQLGQLSGNSRLIRECIQNESKIQNRVNSK